MNPEFELIAADLLQELVSETMEKPLSFHEFENAFHELKTILRARMEEKNEKMKDDLRVEERNKAFASKF